MTMGKRLFRRKQQLPSMTATAWIVSRPAAFRNDVGTRGRGKCPTAIITVIIALRLCLVFIFFVIV
jgi:hypothetical protein